MKSRVTVNSVKIFFFIAASLTVVSHATDGTLIEAYIDKYFDIRIPSEETIPEARAEIRDGIKRFLRDVIATFDKEAVETRLADLAKNNPFSVLGKIPIYYFPGAHPHNVQPGHPYPALVLSRIPDASSEVVTEHELMHLFMGKFNDALAEPVANLFNPLFSDPKSVPGMELSRFALLELRRNGRLPDFGLRALFSIQPTTLLRFCAQYTKGGPEAAKRFEVERSLGDFAEELQEYGVSPRKLALPQIDVPGVTHERNPPNPNETSGAARDALGNIGEAVLSFLRRKGGTEKLLKFYYEPSDANLGQLYGRDLARFSGADNFEKLENALYDELSRKYQDVVGPLADEWKKYLDSIASHPCLPYDRWNDPACNERDLNIAGHKVPNHLPAFAALLTEAKQKTLRISLSQVPKETDGNIKKVPGFKISDYLGHDWDFEKLCDKNKTSGGALPPAATLPPADRLAH